MKLLTKDPQESQQNTKIIYICSYRGYHCHYRGEYRGAVHNLCNLKYIVPTKLPISFHNGFKYDDHFIIRDLTEKFKKNNLRVQNEALKNA